MDEEQLSVKPADDPSESAQSQIGKNIILLSDGTGNSAKALHRTNVWRLYKALDLSGDSQIAFYDDGVGTSGFKPIMILGGVFGYGLARNVRDMYLFLCEHYKPSDRIYLFGFSRGAFTVRTLAGLIGACGILDLSKSVNKVGLFKQVSTRQMASECGLRLGAKLAYKSYRRSYRAYLTNLVRWVRDRIFGEIPKPTEFRRTHSIDSDVVIDLVGVWDTVSAYGLPIDELSVLVNKLIYPMRFNNHVLGDQIRFARQALAIDDERHTFRPLVWDQSICKDDTDNVSPRIKQVWFSGMHSDVGGGYPDDDMAYLALKWMIAEAGKVGDTDAGRLKFNEPSLVAIDQRARATGKMHDSRSGLGIYYRYKPRVLERFCNQSVDENPDSVAVSAMPILIHQGVLDRIVDGTGGYAPTGLPEKFEIVPEVNLTAAGKAVDRSEVYAARDDIGTRKELLTRAKLHVFWQRWLYFVMVFLTVIMLTMPFWHLIGIGSASEQNIACENVESVVLRGLTFMLPDFACRWFVAWEANPWILYGAVVLFVLLKLHSQFVKNNTQTIAQAAWSPLNDQYKLFETKTPEWGEKLTKFLQDSSVLKMVYRFWVRKAIPVVTLVLSCVVIIVVLKRMI